MAMSVKEEQTRREQLAARLCLIWAVLIATAEVLGAFSQLDELFWDAYLQRPAAVAARDGEFALVSIDHIPSDRPWPWSRLNYAILLDSIVPSSPHSVVFEMLLNDRDTQYTAFDSTFAGKVGMFPRTVFAAAVLVRTPPAPLPAGVVVLPSAGPTAHLPQFGAFLWPLDTFANGTSIGIRNLLPEESGRLRRLPLVFRVGSQLVPSLVLQAVAVRRNADLSRSEVIPGVAISLRDRRGNLIQQIPIDDEGRLFIRFRRGQPPPWTMKFDDVPLAAAQAGFGDAASREHLEDLRRRQLWVARTDEETVNTALGPRSPAEVEMDAARAILHNDFIHPLPAGFVFALYLIVCVLGSTLAARWGLIPSVVLATVTALVTIEAGGIAFQLWNMALPVASFLILLGGILFMTFTAQVWMLGGRVQLDLDL